jgi:serine/threonine protein kinase
MKRPRPACNGCMLSPDTVVLHLPGYVQVSRECLDLLSRLLQRDTAKRANLQEIMSHDWIAYNLPPGTVL